MTLSEITLDELDAKLSWHSRNLSHTGELLNLAHHDLRSSDLSGKPLREVALVGSDLTMATLVKTDFSKSDLRYADLRGADCTEAVFDGADLHRTKLQAATLRNVKIEASTGLKAYQLRGSDLTGASLPLGIPDADQASSSIDEASRKSSISLLITLLVSLYYWITLLGTSDLALIFPSSTVVLPGFQTSVPSESFFLVAPTLLFLMYLWMHSSLQNLWDAIGSLPARFPDGRSLKERAYSGLISGFLRVYLPFVEGQHPRITRLQWFFTRFLIWWAVPATIGGFWLRFLVRKSLFVSWFQVVLFSASLFCAQWLWRVARRTLETGGIDQRSPVREFRSQSVLPRRILTIAIFGLVILTTWTAVNRQPAGEPNTDTLSDLLSETLRLVGWSPFFNVNGADLSQKPPDFDKRDLTGTKGGKFATRNLKYSSAVEIFAAKADFSGADLSRSDLRGSDLRYARFDNANLADAILTGADLRGASFTNADLRNAELAKANFQGATIRGTGLHNSDVKQSYNWILTVGNPEDYSKLGLPSDHLLRLIRKDLTDYDFRKLSTPVRLNQADLSDFSLRLARLDGVCFDGARLVRTDFRGTDLDLASFVDADLEKADLRGVDLTQVVGLTAGQVRFALTDGRTKLPGYIQKQLETQPQQTGSK